MHPQLFGRHRTLALNPQQLGVGVNSVWAQGDCALQRFFRILHTSQPHEGNALQVMRERQKVIHFDCPRGGPLRFGKATQREQ